MSSRETNALQAMFNAPAHIVMANGMQAQRGALHCMLPTPVGNAAAMGAVVVECVGISPQPPTGKYFQLQAGYVQI
jgi:hypothetical protein